MKIISVLAVALVGVGVSLLLQNERKEYGLICGVATGVLLLLMVIGELSGIFDLIAELMNRYGVSLEHLTLMIKTIVIAYLCQFGIALCKDAGQAAIALKLEIGGRVLLIACALPAITGLIELGAELLGRMNT